MTNNQVINAWTKNTKGSSDHLSTDGNFLWSYNLKIGYTENSNKYVYNYTAHEDCDKHGNRIEGFFKSMTTSRHVGWAREYAECVPCEEA